MAGTKPALDFTVISAVGDIKAKEGIRFSGMPNSCEVENRMKKYFTWQGCAGIEFGNENMSVGVNDTLQARTAPATECSACSAASSKPPLFSPLQARQRTLPLPPEAYLHAFCREERRTSLLCQPPGPSGHPFTKTLLPVRPPLRPGARAAWLILGPLCALVLLPRAPALRGAPGRVPDQAA